jgi:lipopolysaccharide transport system permease protein
MSFLMPMTFSRPFLVFWRNKTLLYKFLLSDLKQLYAGSLMGLFWMIGLPLIFLSSYAFIYAVIFKVKPPGLSTEEYTIHVCAGIMAFLSFASSLTAGSGSLIQRKDLLTCTTFPIELIPSRAVISNFITLVVGFLCLTAYVYVAKGIYMPVVYGPIIIVLFLMAVLGIIWVLTIVYVFFKDLHQILVFLNMFLLIVSPISYTPAMIPNNLKLIMYLNPITYYIIPLQQVFQGSAPSDVMMMAMVTISFTCFVLGYFIFCKTKAVVMDHV